VNGSERIAAERWRQRDEEGWTPEHDDSHTYAQMTRAAIWYAHEAVTQMGWNLRPNGSWPWAQDWWKPSLDPVRNLEKAGALIAAEIDRLQRVSPSGGPQEQDR
jgi:hypothetical protein